MKKEMFVGLIALVVLALSFSVIYIINPNMTGFAIIEYGPEINLEIAEHLGSNVSEVFDLDGNYYMCDMKDSSKIFYINFSENLENNSIISVYAREEKGVTIGIYSQTDESGNNPLGTFNVISATGEWYNITLNMDSSTNAFWLGEGTGSGTDPKDEFDYIYASNPTSNSPPTISIVEPQNGSTYGYNESLSLNFTVSDNENNIESCWYNLNSGANTTLTNCQNITFDITEDSYILYIYVNDTNGEQASDSSSFNIDVGAPTITLSSPIDEYLSTNSVTFRYTPTDTDLDSCELWGNFTSTFEKNQTDTSPTSGSENTFSLTLDEGTYSWNIHCNDTQAHTSVNGNKTFYIDTTNPQLTLSQPTGAKSSRTVTAQWNVSDSNLNTCWYNVYRGENIEITNTTVECGLNSTSFSVTVDANFDFNFYVNDSAGNSNSSSSSFSVDTSGGSSPPQGGSGGGGGGGSDTTIIITNETEEMKIESISNMIVKPGESKTLTLTVENAGFKFLNDCKLQGGGEYSSWISSDDVKDIGGGEIYDFIFTLEIPETAESGSYDLEVSIECKELSESTSFTAEIIEKKLNINLIEIGKQGNDNLKIIYSLIELSGTSQDVEVEIVLFDNKNERIAEKTETQTLETGSEKQFETLLQIPETLRGDFNLLINANSGVSSIFVQEDVIIGRAGIGVLAIFGEEGEGKFFIVLLGIAFIVFAFIITRRILKFRKGKNKIKIRKIKRKRKRK